MARRQRRPQSPQLRRQPAAVAAGATGAAARPGALPTPVLVLMPAMYQRLRQLQPLQLPQRLKRKARLPPPSASPQVACHRGLRPPASPSRCAAAEVAAQALACLHLKRSRTAAHATSRASAPRGAARRWGAAPAAARPAQGAAPAATAGVLLRTPSRLCSSELHQLLSHSPVK